MSMPPPLRFLALVAGGWTCVRAAMLVPDWTGAPDPTATATGLAPQRVATAPPSPPPAILHPKPLRPHFIANPLALERLSLAIRAGRSLPLHGAAPLPERTANAAAPDGFQAALPPDPPRLAAPDMVPIRAIRQPSLPAIPRARRWSASAWLLLRDDSGGPTLAPGGTLGGSQAGARLLRPIGHGLALSGRLYLPLRQHSAAEAAAGLDWRPVARLPLHVLAERRQALGSDGRSAFALTLYGGVSRELPRRFRIDAYGQAGVVGTRSRDLFIDGSARVSAPLGPVDVGGGVWGAAQPGAWRIDAGPSVSHRLPVRGVALRLQAEWRFRLVGNAAPDSGPALTLAGDF